jgi:hypothetical protein
MSDIYRRRIYWYVRSYHIERRGGTEVVAAIFAGEGASLGFSFFRALSFFLSLFFFLSALAFRVPF